MREILFGLTELSDNDLSMPLCDALARYLRSGSSPNDDDRFVHELRD